MRIRKYGDGFRRWKRDATRPDVEVVPAPPDGYVEDGLYHCWGMKVVRAPDLKGPRYHWCRSCDGWVEGRPREDRVDTLGVLSGRRGTEYYCLRCGGHLGFDGVMA